MPTYLKKNIAILFLLSLFIGKGQYNIDSVKRLVIISTPGKHRVHEYNTLSQLLINKDIYLSKRYADSALVEIGRVKSPEDTLTFYEVEKAHALYSISCVLYQEGKFNDALETCLKALRLYEKHGQKKRLAKSLGNVGGILKQIGSKEAIYYYRKCIEIEQEIYLKDPGNKNFKNSFATSYHNMGAVYAHFNNYDSSMYYFKKALATIDSAQKTFDLSLIYTGIAQANKMVYKFNDAIIYNQKALDICIEINSPDGVCSIYNGFSDIYLDNGNYQKALYYSNLAEGIAKENGFTDELLYVYETKSLVYEKLKDPNNEVLFLKKYTHLKDSLLKQNHEVQIEELKTQYETEKKEKAIIELSKDNKIQELQLERDAATKKLLVIIVIGALLLSAFLFGTIRERRKAYIKLEEKNSEIQNQSIQLSTQARLISKYQSQMNPHFVFNALNSIQGTVLNNEKEKTIELLQLLSQLMRQTLNNSENENIGLDTEINYLKTYVDFERQKFDNTLDFMIELPKDHENILIPPMTIQPFIENSIKHGGLKEISDPAIGLSITLQTGLLKIKITDNGKGFDASNNNFVKTSHAIKIIQSRLAILFEANNMNFREEYFEIVSKPQLEYGTVITFYLPLKYKY